MFLIAMECLWQGWVVILDGGLWFTRTKTSPWPVAWTRGLLGAGCGWAHIWERFAFPFPSSYCGGLLSSAGTHSWHLGGAHACAWSWQPVPSQNETVECGARVCSLGGGLPPRPVHRKWERNSAFAPNDRSFGHRWLDYSSQEETLEV